MPPVQKRSAALLHLLALLLPVLLLAGCWVPEHYSARIKIERDGSYKLSLEGTAVHPEAFRALARVAAEAKGAKGKEEEVKKRRAEAMAALQKDLDQLKDDKRVQGISSLGDGRVRFSLGGAWAMDRSMLIYREAQAPLAYAVGQDGTLRVRVKDAVASRELTALGLATDGDLSVVLAEGIEVLEHNAEKAPSTPRGAYRWRIDATTTEAPYLKLRLPAGAPAPAPARGEAVRERQPHGAPAQKGLAHQ